MDRFYSLTVSYPNAPERTFVAKYDARDWFDNRPCLYAGDVDGGRVSEVPLLRVLLKAQLAAMLCRISSALTLSSPSTTEIADGDGLEMRAKDFKFDNFAVLDNHSLLLYRSVAYWTFYGRELHYSYIHYSYI